MGFGETLRWFISTDGDKRDTTAKKSAVTKAAPEADTTPVGNNYGFDYGNEAPVAVKNTATRNTYTQEPVAVPDVNTAKPKSWSGVRKTFSGKESSYTTPTTEPVAVAAPAPVRTTVSNPAPVVVVSNPTGVGDVSMVLDSINEGKIVFMSLNKCEEKDKLKISVFAAGVAFARRSRFLRIEADHYFIVPDGIAINGQIDDYMNEIGIKLVTTGKF